MNNNKENGDVSLKKDSESAEIENAENPEEKVSDFSNSLIFIDTNIFLDFYRMRNSDISMKLLDPILQHKDSVIITTQVEMEFKKNRQIVFGTTYTELTKTRNFSLNLPHILTVEDEVKEFNETKKKLSEYQRKLENKFAAILTNPLGHDQVYKKLEEIFCNKSEYNLNRDNIANSVIADLARKRFDLGYPPRKNSDNSIGDAINWEWIIQCAKTSGKSVIVISRDSDYGYEFNKEAYLNDWLAQEFSDRIAGENEIFLTNKLTKAFELIKIKVTQEMVEEEQKIISSNDDWQNQHIRDRESSWQAADRVGFSSRSAMEGLFPSVNAWANIPKPTTMQSISPSMQAMIDATTRPSWMNMLNSYNTWDNKINKNWLYGPDKFKGF